MIFNRYFIDLKKFITTKSEKENVYIYIFNWFMFFFTIVSRIL